MLDLSEVALLGRQIVERQDRGNRAHWNVSAAIDALLGIVIELLRLRKHALIFRGWMQTMGRARQGVHNRL